MEKTGIFSYTITFGENPIKPNIRSWMKTVKSHCTRTGFTGGGDRARVVRGWYLFITGCEYTLAPGRYGAGFGVVGGRP